MKKLALLFCLCSSLFADYPDTYVASVEFLYLKPTIEHSFYAINSQNVVFEGQHYPNGTRFNNDPSFHPAFRVEALYGFCDRVHDLDLRFIYFNERHTDRLSGEFLWDTIGYPGDGAQTPEDTIYSGQVSYTQQFKYWGLDAGFHRYPTTPYLSFLGGLHFASIRMNEGLLSTGTSDDTTAPIINNNLRRHSHFWGLGPQFGIDFDLSFCGCFSVGTSARAALLASNTWADLHYVSTRSGPVGVHLDNESLWRISPAFDVKVGVNYFRPFRCLNLSYSFGYELIWYGDAIDAITNYDVAFAGDTIDLFSNFNLQGPYLAIQLTF